MGWEKALGEWFTVGIAVSCGGATTRLFDHSAMAKKRGQVSNWSVIVVEDSTDPSPLQPQKRNVKNTKKIADH